MQSLGRGVMLWTEVCLYTRSSPVSSMVNLTCLFYSSRSIFHFYMEWSMPLSSYFVHAWQQWIIYLIITRSWYQIYCLICVLTFLFLLHTYHLVQFYTQTFCLHSSNSCNLQLLQVYNYMYMYVGGELMCQCPETLLNFLCLERISPLYLKL